MKFPFDFNIAFVFRLVLPGCILAAAFTPLVLTLVAYAGFGAVPLATLFHDRSSGVRLARRAARSADLYVLRRTPLVAEEAL